MKNLPRTAQTTRTLALNSSFRSFLFVLFVINFLILSVFGCSRQKNAEFTVDSVIEEIKEAAETEVFIDPFRVRAEEIVRGMDDRLLASQVLISGIEGMGRLSPNMAKLLAEISPGGIMLFSYNLNTDNDSIRGLLAQTKAIIIDKSGIAPFIAVDHEGGTVNRFRSAVAPLPSAVTYFNIFSEDKNAAFEKIESDSFSAGLEINALGINMNFAPVAETLNDNNRVFLARRSYGPDSDFTARASFAFLQGMEKAGILCVVKHFPGSAGKDPHYSKSILNLNEGELDELVSPFTYLIKNGARAIMAAHTSVPVLDSEIATLSPVVMRNWLRDGLGFDGIIISDDFIMAAAGSLSPEKAAVRSLAAGSDMILVWPADLIKTHNAIIAALEDESLPRERLTDAAVRIVYQKITMGLMD